MILVSDPLLAFAPDDLVVVVLVEYSMLQYNIICYATDESEWYNMVFYIRYKRFFNLIDVDKLESTIHASY
jgi:hypothetical protein